MLTEAQRRRYVRHILLPEVGAAGQERLLASAAAVVGDGRAAEEAATYLCAAGVGRLALAPALIARIGPHLAGLNPDVQVGSEAADACVVAPLEPARRASGAEAALAALVALLGLGAAPGPA